MTGIMCVLVWAHGFWTWDWADSYQRVKRIVPPRSPLPDLKTSWGAIYTIPTVAACGKGLDPLQQQWEFLTINTTEGNISNILSNAYARNEYNGVNGAIDQARTCPNIYNCQKQLLWDGCLSDGAAAPSPACATAEPFGQFQFVLTTTTGQLRSGIPANAPGPHTSYGYAEYVCVGRYS